MEAEVDESLAVLCPSYGTDYCRYYSRDRKARDSQCRRQGTIHPLPPNIRAEFSGLGRYAEFPGCEELPSMVHV